MSRVGSENKIDAARHEAGHAVVGLRAGHKPSSMHIRLEHGRWLGGYGFEPGKVGIEDLAAIAIAGCLAQAKTVAEQAFGTTVEFDKSCDLSGLIHIIRDSDRSTPDVDAGACELVFNVHGKAETLSFDGSWFSGADAGKYRQARKYIPGNNSTDTQLIRSVMEELDDPKNWRAVCALAESVCQQKPLEDGKYELDADAIVATIAKSDNAG